MKIGILTFHKAYNYGAVLQCYSLQKKLSQDFPNDTVEVVNYASKNMIGSYHLSRFEAIFGQKGAPDKPSFTLILKRIASDIVHWKSRSAKRLQAKKRITNFKNMQKHLPLSEAVLVSDDPAEFSAFLDSLGYDVLIVGSDAIWNDNQTSVPNLYFLHDVHCRNKFSYAASTYGMDYSSFDEKRLSYVKESLNGFRFIGVRDSVTESYVENCSQDASDKLFHTCDPSIFLNLQELPVDIAALKEKLKKKGVDFSKPIIGLMCDNWLAKKVRSELGEGYQYVSVYVYTETADVFLEELEPFEWARIFSLFSATFTHYFHGTLFSLKNGTLTYAIEKKSKYNQNYKTKIEDVLDRLHLIDSNYYKFDDMMPEDWSNISENIAHADREKLKHEYEESLAREAESYERFRAKLKEVTK